MTDFYLSLPNDCVSFVTNIFHEVCLAVCHLFILCIIILLQIITHGIFKLEIKVLHNMRTPKTLFLLKIIGE